MYCKWRGIVILLVLLYCEIIIGADWKLDSSAELWACLWCWTANLLVTPNCDFISDQTCKIPNGAEL